MLLDIWKDKRTYITITTSPSIKQIVISEHIPESFMVRFLSFVMLYTHEIGYHNFARSFDFTGNTINDVFSALYAFYKVKKTTTYNFHILPKRRSAFKDVATFKNAYLRSQSSDANLLSQHVSFVLHAMKKATPRKKAPASYPSEVIGES